MGLTPFVQWMLTLWKVVVVGIGNSGVDVASSLVGIAKRVTLRYSSCDECQGKPLSLTSPCSTRSGAWILPNYILGIPFDHLVW